MNIRNRLRYLFPFFFAITLIGCQRELQTDFIESISSPDGQIFVTFRLEDGFPQYQVQYLDQDVILPSKMGFHLSDAPSLDGDFGP